MPIQRKCHKLKQTRTLRKTDSGSLFQSLYSFIHLFQLSFHCFDHFSLKMVLMNAHFVMKKSYKKEPSSIFIHSSSTEY